jgi:hypothetical protein
MAVHQRTDEVAVLRHSQTTSLDPNLEIRDRVLLSLSYPTKPRLLQMTEFMCVKCGTQLHTCWENTLAGVWEFGDGGSASRSCAELRELHVWITSAATLGHNVRKGSEMESLYWSSQAHTHAPSDSSWVQEVV